MLIEKLLAPRASYAPWENFWYELPGTATRSGVSIDPDAALTISAYHAGVQVRSEALAVPPLLIYEHQSEDRNVRARSYGLFEILRARPNNWQTSFEFRVQMEATKILRGNAYAEIVPGPRGAVDQLIPLNSARMQVKKLPNRRLGYLYREDNGAERPLVQDEVFHLRNLMLSSDGITGQSNLQFARESLGLTIALEGFGAQLFSNGALHSGIVKHPGALSDKAHERLRKEINERHAGLGNARGTMILEEGMDWVNRSMSADDAQFLLSKKHQVVEMARWLNMPPHLLRDLEKSSYSNHEQETLEFIMITMLPNYVNWEQAISRDLIIAPQRYYAKFLLDVVTRADIKTRFEAYGMAIRDGWLKRNEVRIKEDMDPDDERLDEYVMPLNMTTVGQMPAKAAPGSAAAPAPMPPAERNAKENSEQAEYLRQVFRAGAVRVTRKEIMAVTKALARCGGDPPKFQQWAERFYSDHAKFVGEVLCLKPAQAEKFAADQKARALLSVADKCADGLVKELEAQGSEMLLRFMEGENNANGTGNGALPAHLAAV